VPAWWVCGKLNGSGAVVKFSLRPGATNRQALAAGLKKAGEEFRRGGNDELAFWQGRARGQQRHPPKEIQRMARSARRRRRH